MFVPSAIRPGRREMETPAVRFGLRAYFNIQLQGQAFGRIVKGQNWVPNGRPNVTSYENLPFECLRLYSRQTKDGHHGPGLAFSRTNRVHESGIVRSTSTDIPSYGCCVVIPWTTGFIEILLCAKAQDNTVFVRACMGYMRRGMDIRNSLPFLDS